MTDPEYDFDENEPSDYRLFGIRYLILPATHEPPVPARPVMRSGAYRLWTLLGAGDIQTGVIIGEISADRADVGARSIALLDSGMRRAGVAVLSASFDPGWTATVNGRRQPTRMVDPALVAVDVPAGNDHVVFSYHGDDDYPELLGLGALVLAIVAFATAATRCRTWRRPPPTATQPRPR